MWRSMYVQVWPFRRKMRIPHLIFFIADKSGPIHPQLTTEQDIKRNDAAHFFHFHVLVHGNILAYSNYQFFSDNRNLCSYTAHSYDNLIASTNNCPSESPSESPTDSPTESHNFIASTNNCPYWVAKWIPNWFSNSFTDFSDLTPISTLSLFPTTSPTESPTSSYTDAPNSKQFTDSPSTIPEWTRGFRKKNTEQKLELCC